jgi:hypothetical protein
MDKFSILHYLKNIGIDPDVILPAFIGAVTSLRKRKGMKFIESCLVVFFGFICALFITPLILFLFSINTDLSGSIGFVVGYGGLISLEKLLDYLHRLMGDDE